MLLTSIISLKSYNNPLHRSNLPGNVNFDPLGLSMNDLTLNRFISQRSPDEILEDYRDAELKHGRLAMLAAVAYPIQEFLGISGHEITNNKISVLLFFIGLASGLELSKLKTLKKFTTPGDYNWRFTKKEYGTDEFIELQAGEVWNGRLAMIATLVYIVQQAITDKSLIFF